MPQSGRFGDPRHVASRVVARVSDRVFVTSDGELVDGSAPEGERVVIFERPGVEGATKVAGGLPVKGGMIVQEDAEPVVMFRLCLDSGEFEPPYNGWLGRLLVLENGSRPKLFAVPHDPKFPGHKEAFGCHLIWGQGLCKAHAKCRNTNGEKPCEATPGGTCENTYETCRDWRNFASCPYTFGEYPCLADPSDDPCQHSVRTCRALATGDWPAAGQSIYAAYGACKNTYGTCEAPASFLPFSPEFHAYCEPRPDPPFELSPHAASHGRCIWLGQSQETLDDMAKPSQDSFRVSRVWVASNSSIRLRKGTPAVMIPTMPSEAMLKQMYATEGATGVAVADLSCSTGVPVHGNSQHIGSVQWMTLSSGDDQFQASIVVNGSADGEMWSEEGKVILSDDLKATYDETAPTWPTHLERTEYRAPRVVQAGREKLLVYTLVGRVAFHTETTGGGGHKRIYDEMWIRLACNGEECTFEPEIAFDGYIPQWPAAPDGHIILAPDLPDGALISTFSFRFGGAGGPTGVYEVALERARYFAFIPVTVVLGHREGPDGVEPITVEALMRYTSDDGVTFVDGTTVKDDSGHYVTCANSVPVCRSWTGTSCGRRDGFCGAVGTDGRFSSLFPHCDGQGTGGAPGGSRWSRYEPGASFRGPGHLLRADVRGRGPSFALAGCRQQGPFACKLKKAFYKGHWCARLDCPGFEPRGSWGAGGIRFLNIRNNDL
ncbi:MAG TPA: hypothetical protein VM163_10170 [bacterium]|nr:hypothetical protein [bacterium]